MIDRDKLRSLVTEYTCGQKCMGQAGNAGGCCTLGDRDFIIGPVPDIDALLERLSERWGRPVLRTEIVIDYEEGRVLFPGRACWHEPSHYPALRVLLDHARLPCRFYDVEKARCSIHDLRPSLCRSYECDWLEKTLEPL